MAKLRLQPNLGSVALANCREQGLGWRKSFEVTADALECAFSLALYKVERDRERIDGWPTQKEYAERMGVTERTAQRQWERFRQAFPGEDGPERIARLIATDFRARLERGDKGFVAELPAALVAA